MARIYNRKGATAVSHEGEEYKAEGDGGFENLPGPLEEHLLGFPDWETDVERQQRIVREDLARRRDPASAYDEFASLRAELLADRRNAPPQAPDLSAMSPEHLEALATAIMEAQASHAGADGSGGDGSEGDDAKKTSRRRTAKGSGSQA